MMHEGRARVRVKASKAGDAVLFCADQQHSATARLRSRLRFSFDVRVTVDAQILH
jgi:hypothetical protein